MGPYDVQRLIGRGGMGEVYLARHRHLDREVALKILPVELAENPAFRDRFIRESQSAASLHHPNIVTVYDAGEADGLLYIAMQYIDGADLAAVLYRDGPLAAARAMVILDQLAAALDAAHIRGLIHRDVKPANVLIDDERAYLTDFGLTKPIAVKTAVTKPGTMVGTVDYVAPEQIRGGPVDTRADVYALGCLLYRALAGEPPFPRDNEMSVIHAHLYDDPPRLTGLRPDLPEALDEVVRTALAKDPAERYGSTTALAVAANQALRRGSSRAEFATTRVVSDDRPTRELGGPGRRRRLGGVRAGVASLAALALAVAAAVVIASGDPDTVAQDDTGKRPAPAPEPVRTEPAAATVPDLKAGTPRHVGHLPAALALGVNGLYVANEGDGTVRRVDPIRGGLDSAKAVVGGGPAAVAVGAGGGWVASRRTNTLTRFDPRTMTVVARIPVGRAPSAVAIGNRDRSVWVANEADGTVMRVDPSTNTVDPPAAIEVGRGPRAIAGEERYAFVANREDGTVTRIDVRSRKPAGTIRVGRRPTALLINNKRLWVANAGDGTVVRVDMRRNRVVGRTRVGGRPVALAGTTRNVFVADRKGGRVIRINPATGKREGNAVAVRDPVAMRAGGGSVWVANRATGKITRIELF